MKEIVKRLMLAAAITLVAFALASLGHAQQADEDPAPATRLQQKPQAVPQSSGKQSASSPAQQNSPANKSSADANDDQTQDALAFTGRIVEQNGELVLNDPVTKLNYQLDDPSKAKPYIGKHKNHRQAGDEKELHPHCQHRDSLLSAAVKLSRDISNKPESPTRPRSQTTG